MNSCRGRPDVDDFVRRPLCTHSNSVSSSSSSIVSLSSTALSQHRLRQSSVYGIGLATRRSRLRFPAAAATLHGWVTVFGRAKHLGISPSHLGQLSLLTYAGREMSTGQNAVMLCSWGVKAVMAHSIRVSKSVSKNICTRRKKATVTMRRSPTQTKASSKVS